MGQYVELDGKTVLITGGANGIGKAMVEAFHGQGAQVLFCDVDIKNGRRVARSLGQGCQFAKVNLLHEREVERWITRAGRAHGNIDVLVNNAASDPRIALEKMSVRQWDELFARNLRA